jgi:HD superfamily phosphohydrolase
MRIIEDRMEGEKVGKAGEIRRSKETSRKREEEMWESKITNTKKRISALEERIFVEEVPPGKKDREAHARIDEIEKDIAQERTERKGFECNIEGEKGIQEAKDSEKDSEKEMEKELEDAMEQVKILNLDFGKECADRKTLVKEAISRIWKKVKEEDREEFGKIMKGARIDIFGRAWARRKWGKAGYIRCRY